MSCPFEPGTIVYLKSGSQPFTVGNVCFGDVVTVEWWWDGNVYAREFHKSSLTTDEPHTIIDLRFVDEIEDLPIKGHA